MSVIFMERMERDKADIYRQEWKVKRRNVKRYYELIEDALIANYVFRIY